MEISKRDRSTVLSYLRELRRRAKKFREFGATGRLRNVEHEIKQWEGYLKESEVAK